MKLEVLPYLVSPLYSPAGEPTNNEPITSRGEPNTGAEHHEDAAKAHRSASKGDHTPRGKMSALRGTPEVGIDRLDFCFWPNSDLEPVGRSWLLPLI
jgi:hypothetical protein